MKPRSQKTFTKELLIFLTGATTYIGEYWIDANRFPGRAITERMHYKRVRHSRAFMQKVRQSLYNLERQGCITRKITGHRVCYTLTNKGRMRLLCDRLRAAPKHPQGTYTLVFFDIPEKRKTVRVLFRRLLKESGFRQWQKSVWGNDRDIFPIIEAFIRHHDIEDWVTVCTTGKVLQIQKNEPTPHSRRLSG